VPSLAARHRGLQQGNTGVVTVVQTNPNGGTNATAATVLCPLDSIYYCDNPFVLDVIEANDPTIGCDSSTCEWDLTLLDPKQKPGICGSIVVDPDTLDRLADLLEPCLWWDMLCDQGQAAPCRSLFHGEQRPTGSDKQFSL
jgi:hypothetical protein